MPCGSPAWPRWVSWRAAAPEAFRSCRTAPTGAVLHLLHAKIAGCPSDTAPMDNEQINLIGTRLTDLSARTDALRGYL